MEYKYKTKHSKDYNTIELGIDYEIGGINYFTGNEKPRCFYIKARAMNCEDNMSTFLMFDDSELAKRCKNVVLKQVKRNNKKKIEKLFDSVDWDAYGEAIEKNDLEHQQKVVESLRDLI